MTHIANAFNTHIKPHQVLHRAGLRQLADGRWVHHHSTANNPRAWIRIEPNGTATAHAWCGISRAWTASNGWGTTYDLTAWDLFVALLADGESQKAVKRALKVPAVAEKCGELVGGLAHV